MIKRKKIIVGILSIALIGSSVIGCSKPEDKKGGGQTGTVQKPVQEEDYRARLNVVRPQAYSSVNGLRPEPGSYISIIGKASGSDYWKEVKAGAEQAVKELNEALGYKGEDKIKINYSGPSKAEDVDEQINILDEELARYPVALGIASVDAAASLVQFDLAAENDIPIIAFDSGSEYQGIEALCSTNNADAAQTAAVKLGSLMEGSGEVALFVHDSKSTTAKEREQGFLAKMAESNPEIQVVNVYRMDEFEEMAKLIAEEKSTPEAPVTAESITEDDVMAYIFEKNPNIKGCFTTNRTTTQKVVKYLDTLGEEQIHVVGFDGGAEQIELLKDGKIDGLVVQNPYGMGYATVVASVRSVMQMGNEAFVDTGYTWVTQENIEEESIQKMMY